MHCLQSDRLDLQELRNLNGRLEETLKCDLNLYEIQQIKIKELQATNETLIENIQDAELKYRELSKKFDELNKKHQDLESVHHKSTEYHAHLSSMHNQSLADNQNLQKHNQALQSEIRDLKNQLGALKSLPKIDTPQPEPPTKIETPLPPVTPPPVVKPPVPKLTDKPPPESFEKAADVVPTPAMVATDVESPETLALKPPAKKPSPKMVVKKVISPPVKQGSEDAAKKSKPVILMLKRPGGLIIKKATIDQLQSAVSSQT